jgi:hypothetical protein
MAVIIGIIGVIDVEVAMPVSAARADVGGLRRVGFLHRGRRGHGGRRNGEAAEQQRDSESGCGGPFQHRAPHLRLAPRLRDDPSIPLR